MKRFDRVLKVFGKSLTLCYHAHGLNEATARNKSSKEISITIDSEILKANLMRIPPAALLVLFIAAPSFAQSASYSFDNFDTRAGVHVYTEPARPIVSRKSRRSSKSDSSKTNATNEPASTIQKSLVQPTIMTFNVAAANADVSALRGFTTGSPQVDGYLIDSGKTNGVDPLLIYSVMHQESSFKSHAVSPKGARGLMQLMPGTAVRYGVTNIFDPRQNIEGGARYLRFLLDHFDGDVNLALAGYNAGEGTVEKYGWRIPPYTETQEYVRRISQRYSLLRDPNAALYAPRLNSAQAARLLTKQAVPLAVYERTVATVRLPDGRLQLMSQ
jgi:soluble lytic murein transglycosylase-like protein